MYSGSSAVYNTTIHQSESIYPRGIDHATHRQIYDAAREFASDEYSQSWAIECALDAADWLRTNTDGALAPAAQARLSPDFLRDHIVVTKPRGANNVYESAMSTQLARGVRVDGISFRSLDDEFHLIVVDDQSDRWASLDAREQQFWIEHARTYRPTDVEPTLLLNIATVLARDEQLRRTVNEEIIHSVQDGHLPDPAKEVLARYLEYQMPLGSIHPPQDVIRCFTFINQLAARHGLQTILQLNHGTLSNTALRAALIDQICEAAHDLISPVVHETYSISNH